MEMTKDKWQPTARDAIAFVLFLQTWLDDREDLDTFTDEDLSDMWAKWSKEWMASLKEEHCGDCTNMPAACARCHTEDKFRQADRILGAMSGKE
jgi:hypothetical protein